MQIHHLHDWNVTPEEAVTLQKSLVSQLIDAPIDIPKIRLIAGVDVSVKNDISQAAVVVSTYPDLKPVETVRAQRPTTFPYIPGLLTFREGWVLEDAFTLLKSEPDVLLFDGMGRIHPRGIGIAAHMGLWLDKPTIGCGKTHFMGEYVEPGNNQGDYSPLRIHGDLRGVVLRTKTNVKPVYISPGHRADIDSAVAVTLAVTGKYRLPLPIRMAHMAAGEYSTN